MCGGFESTGFHIAEDDDGGEGKGGVVVDEARRLVVACVVHKMVVKGVGDVEERTVLNEVTWWLWCSEDGRKVERSREVLDGVAAGEIARLMGAWRNAGGANGTGGGDGGK